ncbi:hypothetical protein [Streptomyces coffeae]|uniref:Uncharacterized protein n=1 Tax=Streptomyces coffeae TaxID=621382 RepID=A0ABS1NJY3_9ACTN|nr:hypothetical protein [Streptomyces coffeae]MBL1100195.1 hypothetical protein [Streptomyces coffeae]
MESRPENGPRRPPANAEDALEIARTRFSPVWPDGTPAPLEVRAFDIGYLITARLPPRPEPTEQPAGRPRPRGNPGGTCVVVSKATGELSTLPYRPPATAIALYRKRHGPDAQNTEPAAHRRNHP